MVLVVKMGKEFEALLVDVLAPNRDFPVFDIIKPMTLMYVHIFISFVVCLFVCILIYWMHIFTIML